MEAHGAIVAAVPAARLNDADVQAARERAAAGAAASTMIGGLAG